MSGAVSSVEWLSGRLVWPETWYQFGLPTPPTAGVASLTFPAVFASIDIISSDIARLPMRHYIDDGTERQEVKNSWPVRVLDHPNEYQTGFDLMKGLIASQLFRGNGYLYPFWNKRQQIDELHCLYPDHVWVYRSGRDIFYRVSAEPLADLDYATMVPPRNMFHHRMLYIGDPLFGLTPMLAAAISSQAGLKILHSANRFFGRMSRPSGILTTAQKIDPAKADAIKERWRRVYAGEEGAGDTVVLEDGLDWKPLTMTAVDAQLIDQLRYSVEDVARVYRLPLFMLGDLTKVSYSSSEQLTRIYWMGCLAAHMEALESRLSRFFGLDGRHEYLEFDLDALFRTEMQTRIEALAKSVQGGIRTPNEARRIEGLNAVEGGDTVFMQQQMVPVSTLSQRTDLAQKPAAPPPSAPTPPAPPARDFELDADYIDRLQDELIQDIFDSPAPARRQQQRRIESARRLRLVS